MGGDKGKRQYFAKLGTSREKRGKKGREKKSILKHQPGEEKGNGTPVDE